MKNMFVTGSLLLGSLVSCNSNQEDFDATGVFEAKEIIVSAESSGQLLTFDLEEGATLTAGQKVGLIDCENLNLQKSQLEASLDALPAKKNSAGPQIEILKTQLVSQEKALAAQREQLQVLEREQRRVQNLAKSDAVPARQADDINGQVAILTRQIAAAESQLAITRQQMKSQQEQVAIANKAVMSETRPMQERIAQVENMIGKCSVINPVSGTVLVKYAEQNEMAAAGKALYKLADLNQMKLRAYITNDQLAALKTGQQVIVLVDNGEGGYKELSGTVEWISDKAEFTPKTIQTKDERANLVYATKIAVKNDGYLKLGMYGEVRFNKPAGK